MNAMVDNVKIILPSMSKLLESENVRELAEHGDANAQFTLSEYYIKGDRVAKNYVEAVKWLRKVTDTELSGL